MQDYAATLKQTTTRIKKQDAGSWKLEAGIRTEENIQRVVDECRGE